MDVRSCFCLESDGMGYLKHASHFLDRNMTLQSCNEHRSVEITEFSSRGHVGVMQCSISAADYKGALMHTGHSQKCNCARAS